MRKLISITALAAVAVMACVSVASAATHTTVTTDGVFYASGETLFSGDVISVKKACANKRVVTIFRKRPGADQKIGVTKSKEGLTIKGLYFWTFAQKGLLPKGTYYSVVKPTDGCLGARSTGYAGPG